MVFHVLLIVGSKLETQRDQVVADGRECSD